MEPKMRKMEREKNKLTNPKLVSKELVVLKPCPS